MCCSVDDRTSNNDPRPDHETDTDLLSTNYTSHDWAAGVPLENLFLDTFFGIEDNMEWLRDLSYNT